MSPIAPMPTRGRVTSLLWFPFFLVASMSILFIGSFADPAPNAMKIAVVGKEADVAAMQAALEDEVPGGFEVERLRTAAQAPDAVLEGDVAAAVVPATGSTRILVASGAGATRATYLGHVLPPVTGGEVEDLLPLMPGDASGAGIFFYALPLAIAAMVTAIVLLQLGMWSGRRKAAAIAAVGAFGSAATYGVATWQEVLPLTGESMFLVLGAFLMVLAIGVFLTGLSAIARQYFVPLALTFVLVIGIPTSGANVMADMLPTPLGYIHLFMPFGQFVDLVRSLAYGVGSPLGPTLSLVAWLLLGIALNLLAGQRSRGPAHGAVDGPPPDDRETHQLHGSVMSLSARPVVGAAVRVLSDDGSSSLQAATDTTGSYSIDGVPSGTHHVLVTAFHAEPEIITVSFHARASAEAHDFVVQLWDDPAANFSASTTGERVHPA